ncbi:hypothetical protein CR513_07354, partial [Mucuna pruriens]
MINAKGISTPMVSTSKLNKFDIDIISNLHLYRYIMGLQYLTLTRPKIASNVNKVVQKILKYLKGSMSYVPTCALMLLCDNLSVIILLHNLILHAQTKHLKLDLHFLIEKFISKALLVHHVQH